MSRDDAMISWRRDRFVQRTEVDFSGILHYLIVGDLALGVAFSIVVLVLGSHRRSIACVEQKQNGSEINVKVGGDLRFFNPLKL